MLWSVLLACGGPPPVPSEPPPDVVVHAPLSVGGPPMEVAIRGAAVSRIDAPHGAPTLSGDLVTAGFVDAHGHVDGLGQALTTLDLTGAPGYLDTIALVTAAPSGDGWLEGHGWDQNDWPDAPLGGWPRASEIDGVTDRPTVLRRIDGHALWLNHAALTAAGIDKSTPDPAGGQILRDANGAPTGVLIDNAVDLVKIPDASPAAREKRVRAALTALAADGLTGVDDMGEDDATLAILTRLDEAHELPIRVWAYLDPKSEAAQRLFTSGPWHGDHLAVVGIKGYADGALGSRGALLSAPYADAPETSGLAVTPAKDLAELASKTIGAGGQIAIHAIGDEAVHEVLDAFAYAEHEHPDRVDTRPRVEHAQVIRPDDLARFGPLGAIASMQPTHATSDMPWAETRLGPDRIGWAYAWRAVLDAKIPLAFGSDFPVESPEPGAGLWAATTRTDASGRPAGGWHPDQRLTMNEAISAFTKGAAYAVHAEDRFGEIAEGQPADLTVWKRTGDHWTATATVVDGVIAWKAP